MVGKNETASKETEIKSPLTKEEFEKNYCEKSNITEAEYHENFVTLPCSCGDSLCKGWACVVKNARSIKAHRDLYMKK